MTIHDIIQDRNIEEVLHFTTNRGILGILYSRSLKSRKRLVEDNQLEFILKPNASFRKDESWIDYANLSLSRINSDFFEISSNRWHANQDLWWCILSFSPDILHHNGVFFTTTNNIYPSVLRGQGALGLDAMFASTVKGRYGRVINRFEGMPENFTTCEQAEVLYPGEVSTHFLQRIYVRDGDSADEIHAQLSAVYHEGIEVVVDPRKFNGT